MDRLVIGGWISRWISRWSAGGSVGRRVGQPVGRRGSAGQRGPAGGSAAGRRVGHGGSAVVARISWISRGSAGGSAGGSPADRPVDRPVGRLAGRPADQLVDQPAARPADRPVAARSRASARQCQRQRWLDHRRLLPPPVHVLDTGSHGRSGRALHTTITGNYYLVVPIVDHLRLLGGRRSYTATIVENATLTTSATLGEDWNYYESPVSTYTVTTSGGDGSTAHESGGYDYTFCRVGTTDARSAVDHSAYTFSASGSSAASGSVTQTWSSALSDTTSYEWHYRRASTTRPVNATDIAAGLTAAAPAGAASFIWSASGSTLPSMAVRHPDPFASGSECPTSTRRWRAVPAGFDGDGQRQHPRNRHIGLRARR